MCVCVCNGFVWCVLSLVESSEHHRHPAEPHGPKHDRLPAQELPEIRKNTVTTHTHATGCEEWNKIKAAWLPTCVCVCVCVCVCAGTAGSRWAAWTHRSNSMNLTLQQWSTTSDHCSTSPRWERWVLDITANLPSRNHCWSVALRPFLIRFWSSWCQNLPAVYKPQRSDFWQDFTFIMLCILGWSLNWIQMHEIKIHKRSFRILVLFLFDSSGD